MCHEIPGTGIWICHNNHKLPDGKINTAGLAASPDVGGHPMKPRTKEEDMNTKGK